MKMNVSIQRPDIFIDRIGIYDILYILIKKLNIDEIINLLLTNKKIYAIYLSNNVSINKILITKIFEYFKFDIISVNSLIKKISIDEISNITKIVCKKYNYFKRHMFCYKCDFIIFMLDNNICSDLLFEYYISICRFLSYVNDNNQIRTIRYNESHDIFYFESQTCMEDVISIYDMEYILENVNYNQLKIILKKFNIPITMLYRIIRKILSGVSRHYMTGASSNINYKDKIYFSGNSISGNDNDSSDSSNSDSNNNDSIDNVAEGSSRVGAGSPTIKLCIDYIFYRHCFKTINNNVKKTINYIIDSIIFYKKTDLLKYFLYKKNYYNYNNILDYQYIVNKCIEYEDTQNLELLIKDKENCSRYDGDNINTNNSLIIINHKILTKLCKKGSFKYLKYIVERLLGVYINSNLYIESICDGINEKTYKLEKAKLKNLKDLYKYFTDKNKKIIDNTINQVID